MDILGKWIVKKVLFPTEEDLRFLTREEVVAIGMEDPEQLEIFCTCIEVKKDGTVPIYMQRPKRRVKFDEVNWYEREGVYYYMLDGEEYPFEMTEDGFLKFCMGTMLMERQK